MWPIKKVEKSTELTGGVFRKYFKTSSDFSRTFAICVLCCVCFFTGIKIEGCRACREGPAGVELRVGIASGDTMNELV